MSTDTRNLHRILSWIILLFNNNIILYICTKYLPQILETHTRVGPGHVRLLRTPSGPILEQEILEQEILRREVRPSHAHPGIPATVGIEIPEFHGTGLPGHLTQQQVKKLY